MEYIESYKPYDRCFLHEHSIKKSWRQTNPYSNLYGNRKQIFCRQLGSVVEYIAITYPYITFFIILPLFTQGASSRERGLGDCVTGWFVCWCWLWITLWVGRCWLCYRSYTVRTLLIYLPIINCSVYSFVSALRSTYLRALFNNKERKKEDSKRDHEEEENGMTSTKSILNILLQK